MINYKIRVRNLIRKYHSSNPYIIAKALGIEIREIFLSREMPKGLFKKMLEKKFIVINLTKVKNEADKLFVLAHELGHALYHASNRTFFLHDHTFYQRGRFENEANKFAAELLIDDKEIDIITLNELSMEQLANYYGVPQLLIEYKFNKKFL